MTYLLDTTVLMYAVGDQSHALAAPARRLIGRVASEPGVGTTTPEVLQEFLHVRARRNGRAQAALDVEAFADLLSPLVTVNEDDIRAAALLFTSYEQLGAFDSVLAAVAMSRDELELVSGDSAFATVESLAFRDLAHA